MIVDASEAESRFDEWLELVERGEQVVLVRNGAVIARMLPIGSFPGDQQVERNVP